MARPTGPAETPEQIADHKAERSRQYRASQTTRNLVAALLVTLAVVAVIVFAVPRGEPAPRDPIDVALVASDVESAYDRPVLVPEVPASWLVNVAKVEGGAVPTWGVAYVPDEASFVNIAQGFDADETWAAQRLGGAAPNDSVVIDGLTWDRYEFADPAKNANVSYALGIQAGSDHVLVYGSASADTAAEIASAMTTQLRALQEAPE